MLNLSLQNPAAVARRITTVRDSTGRLRDTAAVLDPLTAEGLATLRRQVTIDHAAGRRTLHCPECGGALLVCVLSVGFTGIPGGGRAYLKHRADKRRQFCSLATERGRSPDAVDAARFDGLQEGRHHDRRKRLLAAALAADDRFDDVAIERDIVHGDHRRRPDVQARLGARLLAFEVQHASPLLTTVLGRTQFYAGAGYGVVWLLDGDAPDAELLRQGFQDVAWPQGGRVLALSEATLAASAETGCASVLVLTFSEADGGIHIDRSPCDLVEAIDLVAPDGASRAAIALDPLAVSLFSALRDGEPAAVRRAIFPFCRHLRHAGGPTEAEADGLHAAIAATATVLTGGKFDASAFAPEHTAAIVNNFLTPPRRHAWAPLLALAGEVSPEAARRLAVPSTARKLAAALSSHGPETLAHGPVGRWSPILLRLFPQIGAALAHVVAPDAAI
ncbi:hypothetical protein LGQ03_05920 [Loktanella sp. TSTF-M6]|uniref:DUF6035 domain-containing protein n=1 Tax=Loktanella gaetbuli TaxID=2881335 RepID=A0ABS8BTG9_9RHOB|nr:hypothetical protein [Loktanella gaetbuli]MCB5198771.1 hypothetical protein [Loktanella gaetbuli]